ncbi:MAG: type II toxin-antitoxin system Phd/YefM family antitoxin [Mojavia pulchra JT2-VF2]|jgi:prevent-host-death family protein|uniref:Antitoxin n=1 Tax=Mojavia pulchra JT2-VF2 TaxID=287848 RepID=A0A951PW56_9NOST|nr:type II toxin-antitoxin system Phd/YefM family antitoxin [Mojavia pulchra JT2-VF2]
MDEGKSAVSQQYSIEQLPTNLDKIFQEVEQRESVKITRHGQQVAVILPMAEYARLTHGKTSFRESLEQFRQEIIEEGIEIDPDEVWKDVRNEFTGREVNF